MDQHMVRISLYISAPARRWPGCYLNAVEILPQAKESSWLCPGGAEKKKVGLVRFELTIDGSLRY